MDRPTRQSRTQQKLHNRLKVDRDRFLERLETMAAVLRRYKAWPDYTGMDKWQQPIEDRRAEDEQNKRWKEISAHMALHHVKMGKHMGLEWVQDGTLCRVTLSYLPTLLKDTRAAYSALLNPTMTTRSGPSPRALGPFDTGDGRDATIAQLKRNLATARKSGNKALVECFERLVASAEGLTLYPVAQEEQKSEAAEDGVAFGYREEHPFHPCAGCGRDSSSTLVLVNGQAREVWTSTENAAMICPECGVPLANERAVSAHNTAA